MFRNKTAIVTGAGQGIGKALAIALAEAGTRVFVADLSRDLAESVSNDIDGFAFGGDLRDPLVIQDMITAAHHAFGDVDMLFSNAGFATGEPDGPTSRPDEHWQSSWDLHVMAHLRASRLVLPKMLKKRSGVLVNVASAAGVLSQIGDAAYSASKHAAVSLAQSLAIEYGDSGIHVSVVCPLYVATPMLGYSKDSYEDAPAGVLTAEAVAASVLTGVQDRKFMIYPHPEAQQFFEKRAGDMDRWIAGMRRLRAQVIRQAEGTSPADIHRFI